MIAPLFLKGHFAGTHVSHFTYHHRYFYCIFGSLAGILICLTSPRNPKHVMTFGRMYGKLSHVFGIKMVYRIPEEAKHYGSCVYVGNHQNNYDMITMSNAVQPRTVTVGKRSLIWIPFFGQLYWISGNILIDRSNRSKAHNTITRWRIRSKTQYLCLDVPGRHAQPGPRYAAV